MMAGEDKIKPSRSWVANYVPTALDANELAINWVDAKAYTRNPSGNIVSITLGGSGGSSSSIVEAATVAGFPSTGASQTLFVSRDSGRVFRWDSSGVYIEIGN
jgi:hypothetical protein